MEEVCKERAGAAHGLLLCKTSTDVWSWFLEDYPQAATLPSFPHWVGEGNPEHGGWPGVCPGQESCLGATIRERYLGDNTVESVRI